jgi:hypothetical protein
MVAAAIIPEVRLKLPPSIQPAEFPWPSFTLLNRGLLKPNTYAAHGTGHRDSYDDGPCISTIWLVKGPGNQLLDTALFMWSGPREPIGFFVGELSGQELLQLIADYRLKFGEWHALTQDYMNGLR